MWLALLLQRWFVKAVVGLHTGFCFVLSCLVYIGTPCCSPAPLLQIGLADCAEHMQEKTKPFSQLTCCAVLQLREIAPEFYTPLQCHTSWCWVIWKFLSDPAVGPWTRMKRETREGTEGGQEPIALHTKTAFADITNLPTLPAGKAVKAA